MTKNKHLLICMLMLAIAAVAVTASAAWSPRVIQIVQIDSPGQIQTTLCQQAKASCHINMPVVANDTKQIEPIDVNITSTPSVVLLEVTTSAQHARTEIVGKHRIDIDESGRAVTHMKLTRPPEYGGGESLLLRVPDDYFAELAITVSPVM